MNEPNPADQMIRDALERVDLARQSPHGSTARLAALEEATALAGIVSAVSLMDLAETMTTVADRLEQLANYQPPVLTGPADIELDNEPEASPFLHKGLRVVSLAELTLQGEVEHGVIVGDVGESEGAVWWPVLWDGTDTPSKTWQTQLEPEPVPDGTPAQVEVVEGGTATATVGDDGITTLENGGDPADETDDDDWPEVMANPVFAEAKANPTKKAKAKK